MGKIIALFIFFYNSFAMFSVQLEKRNKTLKRYDQICFPKNSWFSIESMSANLLELTFPNVSRYTHREHTFISQPANNWGPFLIKYHWPQWCEVMQQLEGFSAHTWRLSSCLLWVTWRLWQGDKPNWTAAQSWASVGCLCVGSSITTVTEGDMVYLRLLSAFRCGSGDSDTEEGTWTVLQRCTSRQ